jgi:hypothetical protein
MYHTSSIREESRKESYVHRRHLLTCRRDDKRFTEKKNKTERARRKKEDNVRVRELVDAVLAVDPRIKRIKEEEKAARLAKKNGGKATPAANGSGKSTPAAATAQLTPAQKKAAEAAKKEEERKALEATKGDREAAKKAKEAARKNLKKWKKVSTILVLDVGVGVGVRYEQRPAITRFILTSPHSHLLTQTYRTCDAALVPLNLN